jgi:hypothetical protein
MPIRKPPNVPPEKIWMACFHAREVTGTGRPVTVYRELLLSGEVPVLYQRLDPQYLHLPGGKVYDKTLIVGEPDFKCLGSGTDIQRSR